MKVTQDAALSLLNKYIEERTPVFAALVTPSVSLARVTGRIRISIADGVPRLVGTCIPIPLNPITDFTSFGVEELFFAKSAKTKSAFVVRVSPVIADREQRR
jgi:hypothetical protein